MIDLRTLAVVAFFEMVCFGGVLALYNYRRRLYPGSAAIGYGMLWIGISAFFIANQGRMHPLLSVVLANLVCVIGYCCINHGFKLFLNLKANIANYALINVLTILWFTYFSMVRDSYFMRASFITIVYTIIFLDNFKILYFHYVPEIKKISRFTAIVFLTLAFSYMVRLALIFKFNGPHLHYMIETGPRWHYLTTLAISAVTIAGIFLTFVNVILMISVRGEAELRQTHCRLIESKNSREKFFSMIAHDLISPFSGIPNLTKFLLENYEAFPDDKIKSMLGDIQTASERTKNLLENLLIWSKAIMDQTPFNPESNDVRAMFDEVISMNSEFIKSKGARVDNFLSERFFVECDANMARTIIRNLMSNAIKFTPANGIISITEKGAAGFTVKNGIGIKNDIAPKLFKIGERVSSAGTGGEKGNGIGLLIVKEFVDKHGGEIFVETSEDHGTAVTVLFSGVNKEPVLKKIDFIYFL